jgi:adenine-specific DNA-methyltransferase
MSSSRKRAAKAGQTPVEAIKHTDRRTNIPTNELRGMLADEERAPTPVMYPRDPSLDPQLVWKGKDEQDASDLEIPVVPIYIQEKIQPRVIIENLRATAQEGVPEPELTLFDDFNGISFEDLVDFYQHDQNWSNRLVLGDSLLVMTSLAEKEGLRGKVQTIYVDPPYGIKFGSNWQVSTRRRDVKDGNLQDISRQPEQIRAFRDTWELGIHSYLAYLRDRLVVARDLLAPTGSIFVQIGDENVHLVRALLDEVFGPENFASMIAFATTAGAGSFAVGTNVVASVNSYLLWFAKSLPDVKYRQLFTTREIGGAGGAKYTTLELPDGQRMPAAQASPEQIAAGRLLRYDNLTSQTTRIGQTTVFPVEVDGKVITPRTGGWKTNREGMERLVASGRVVVTGNTLSYLRYFDDFPAFPLTNSWPDIGGIQSRADPKVYAVQTATKAVERCLLMTTDPGDLVLDPTCGSGTTAVVSELWGRRWIAIDTSRVALALARTRLMARRYPWFRLVEDNDVRRGIRCRTVPHVTLKSIAQNHELRDGLNKAEVDIAIARNADHEALLDQPEEDRSKIRVTGPFTVESLSPHRTLDASEPSADPIGADFVPTILDNLKKAGVQNTIKQDHLNFDWMEAYPGLWVNARGAFTDSESLERTVAISIGPEYGTVDADHIREAAKEAIRGSGTDLLLVCAFAFDATASETAKEFQPSQGDGWAVAADERRLGKLRVLLVRMNPDLAMGADLLKKTGAGNLFMVFGEPDIEIRERDDMDIEVVIRGVDVYDPTTGQVRSNTTDDIACWFIDTNYNEESFFVREAYFTGAGDPYGSLRNALRADIDEAAWSSLYSTVSRPFARPGTGKIAIKVINHYGDEVMKVYSV